MRKGFRHGFRDHDIYEIWCGMKKRCYNAACSSFPRYGGRGIQVCERWRKSVAAFYADMGDRPSKLHTLERIDNNGHYEPGNCRWATRAEQNNNTKRTRFITHDGLTLSMKEWADRCGMNRGTLVSRVVQHKWPVSRALTTPVASKKRPS
jgi:hypothetical protein